MPFPLETLIAAPLIGLLAYIILGISGFGSALVSIPLLVHFLPLQTVVPLAVLVDFLATATTGIRFRGDVAITELKFVVPPMIAGILTGVTLLTSLPKQATVILLGIFVTGYGIYRIVAQTPTTRLSRWWGIPTGLFGGLVGGLFGVGGPIYAAYLTSRISDYTRMRATLSAVFSCSTGFRIVVFLFSGLMLQKDVLWGLLLLVPSMLIGLTIGHRLHAKLSRAQVGGFITVLLIASGISLLWKAF